MAANVHGRTKLTATGSMVEAAGKYRIAKGDRIVSALSLTKYQPRLSVTDAKGSVKRSITAEVKPDRVIQRFKNRFVTQSLKRTTPKELLGREDKGYGSSCPIRVIRKIIHVGRPEYQGAGIWA
jgi:hypothetical protein